MALKQKTVEPDDEKPKASTIQGDPKASDAAAKGKDFLKKLDEQPKRRGHYESCCGVRYWVED